MKKKFVASLFVLLFFSLLILGLPNVLIAQIADKEKLESELAKRKELEKRTLVLLDEIAGAAWSLKLPENRSYVLASAADALWSRDEKRARSLYWEALNSLNLPTDQTREPAEPKPTNETKPSSVQSPNKERVASLNQYNAAMATRREFLSRVARRDPQLALDMLRATRLSPPIQAPETLRFADESDFEQEIAAAAMARDPKTALRLAREGLSKGVSLQLLNLLFQLNQNDQAAATEFAGDIITKLESENFETNAIAPLVAMQLLEFSRQVSASLSDTSGVTSRNKRLKLDDSQRQSLAEMIADAALSVTDRGRILQNINWVLPEIEQFAPEKAIKLKARLAEFNRSQSKSQRDWNTFNSSFDKSTPEEMVRAGDKVGEEQRKEFYREAVTRAVGRGRAEEFRQFIDDHVTDESRRREILDQLSTEQLYAALNSDDVEGLQKLLPLIRAKEMRALAMAQLAIRLEKKGAHDDAISMLDAARPLVNVDLANEPQSNASLAVMIAYASIDPPKAFAMIEPIIDRANEDVSKLILVDRIVKTGVIKNGEIMVNHPQIGIENSILDYSLGIVALSKADFERTKALADRFQRDELRIVARLLLAQAVLKSDEVSH